MSFIEKRREAVIYAQCMTEVRSRTFVIRDLVEDMNQNGDAPQMELYAQMVEMIFVQVRKILELIAFGSLTANREVYERVSEVDPIAWTV